MGRDERLSLGSVEQVSEIVIIGSGGNINKLYKLAETKDEKNESFPVAELSRLYHTLSPLSIEQRMDRYSMRKDRADVIIPAAGFSSTSHRQSAPPA